jgi:hypothetical protein
MKKLLTLILLASAFSANAYQLRTPAGVVDVVSANIEGNKATYSANLNSFVPVANATDFMVITGAAGKVVTITQIRFTGAATTSAYHEVYGYKRSASNTGGTSSASEVTKYDSADAAPSATVVQYTVNPTALGAGTLARSDHIGLPAAAAGTFSLVWNFTDHAAKGIKLRSATESFAINWGGTAVPAGIDLHVTIEWTEE